MFSKTSLILSRIERWLVDIAAFSLFLIMLVVVLDVILRYGFNSPLAWSYELISMYLMVIVFFFALSDTLQNNAHIAVDIFHIKMGERSRHLCLAIGYWASLVLFLLVIVTAAEQTYIGYINNEVTDGLIEWPMWLSWLSVPIGVSLLSLRILFRALGHTISVIENRSVIDLPLISGHETE